MDVNILITGITTLASGIVGSISTLLFTNSKERRNKRRAMLELKLALYVIVENVFIPLHDKEIKELQAFKESLIGNSFYRGEVSDRPFLKTSLYESFQEKDINSMCLTYNLPISFFYTVLKNMPNIYNITVAANFKSFTEELEYIRKNLKLDSVIENSEYNFINNTIVQNCVKNRVDILERNQYIIEASKQDLMKIVGFLK